MKTVFVVAFLLNMPPTMVWIFSAKSERGCDCATTVIVASALILAELAYLVEIYVKRSECDGNRGWFVVVAVNCAASLFAAIWMPVRSTCVLDVWTQLDFSMLVVNFLLFGCHVWNWNCPPPPYGSAATDDSVPVVAVV
jgi:hypothetical protein